MEAQQGGRGVQRTERVCSREEKKRRRTSGLVEDRASSQQRYPSFSSASSSSYDDRSSAASGLDVADRLTYLEQRMQMQEDEIQLLKLALADVLKRLNISEEHQAAAAAGRRMPGAKARPVSLALPPRTSMATSSSTSLKKSSTVPSSATARNYSPAPPPLSGVKSPPGGAKDSPCKITKPRPASAASVCKKVPEESNKSSEPAVSVGTRRVTHCKVTMQIYLSPLARKTGSSEEAKSASAVPAYRGPVAGPGPPPTKRGGQPQKKKSTPSFTLSLQKTVTGQSSAQETSSYISPVKSPSQYFQICY
ncbi:echinoderm microtubule-associated protein-like 1 isoform X4 [Xiphophorus maculatus]|uniref:Echinoderm microtubule-associated protein-like 1 n=1 Tax=Xiphophorus maculatus TaxID=8083 RepID=A0A3B5QT62_XIPMA|nr:echinoderm microtubule-associated protein-like 1 isoform X4 [Xiphophorus maculatus]